MINILLTFFLITTAQNTISAPRASHLRPSSYPFIAGDTFRSIANHIVDETDAILIPENVKTGDIIFVKQCPEYIKRFFYDLYPRINARFILIMHNGDISIPNLDYNMKNDPELINLKKNPIDIKKYLNDDKIIYWFTTNLDELHSKLISIPIGIANMHWEHGKIETFAQATKNIPDWSNREFKVYINYNANNNPIRPKLLNYFKDKNYCYITTTKNHQNYLEEIKKYIFVLSPPGNGIDCHRTWEALLMGCIPIVERSLLEPLYKDLPIMIIDDWSEITPNNLLHCFEKFKNLSFNREKIYARYWIERIKSYVPNSTN